MRPSRRSVLRAGLLSGLVSLVPARARAADPDRRFLFVFCDGGWDPLVAFAPVFGSEHVDMDPAAAPGRAGGIDFVDHPDRPSVRAYFEAHGARTALVNGLSVPSVSHDVCRAIALTGSSAAERPDWATLLGAAAPDEYLLPSLVLGGPSLPGDQGIYSARVGTTGQLQKLVDRRIFELADVGPVRRFSPGVESAMDAVLLERTRRAKAGAASAGRRARLGDLHASLERAVALKDGASHIDLSYVSDFASQLSVAVSALEMGMVRCASVRADGYYGLWDTHTDNELYQSLAFEWMFAELSALLDTLGATKGPDGRPLLETTTLVVLSEMGRTPKWNAGDGRDHWPFTSALLAGAGIAGGQVVGGYDDALYGTGYDAATGPDDTAPPLTPEHLGATLLALAGEDPAPILPAAPIAALIA